ncbi:GNAT family N-acetyltransferase [Paenibacillus sp. 481]|uniref:GNAT family N-acetyltransferase n=1 Tax=Paenibacillus sp. 481 TaxID=2835869 RepID=UPI001E48B791|nr:GNAT family protein [Paenibacillus sp. 481]UHA72811.1 GNAT family N-acetyltransferase [Paenibacillus sp. 481]
MPHYFGNRIRLREYRESDMEAMRKWVNDPEVTESLHDLFLSPHSYTTTESFKNEVMKPRDNIRSFVIAEKESEAYIGQIDLHIDWKNRIGTIGIVIGRKELFGQGYGEEAIRVLQAVAFDQLQLNRVQLEVLEPNERAYRCYIKCGFVEEGRQRQRVFRNGRYLDMIGLGLLREQYEQDERQQPYRKLAYWGTKQLE